MKTFHSQAPQKHNDEQLLTLLPSHVKREIDDAFGGEVTEEILSGQQVKGNEDLFLAFEEVLPLELVKRKLEECIKQNKNVKEALYALLSLMEKRSNTWEVDGNELYKEEALTTINHLNGVRFNQSLLLGKGDAGHVFSIPEATGYCIKYIHNEVKKSFTAQEEHALLGQVNLIARIFKQLHVPQAHSLAKNMDGTKSFFTMEKIEGLTFKEIADFPSKRKPYFPDFDIEKFTSTLEDLEQLNTLIEDLTVMHEAGVVHGDIHQGNLMIDSAGRIFLIDFGNSIVPVNVSPQVSYEKIEQEKEKDLRNLVNAFETTVISLKKELTKFKFNDII